MDVRRDGALELLAKKLTRMFEGASPLASRGVEPPFCFRNMSSLEVKLKFGIEGTDNLKFESCQLSLIAFKRLFTCSDTCSNRESSPSDEASERER
jgi:hypothetical protein